MTETTEEALRRALQRASELLDATARYMGRNPIAAEYTVTYDEAECDGGCLQDDCETALADARAALSLPVTPSRVEYRFSYEFGDEDNPMAGNVDLGNFLPSAQDLVTISLLRPYGRVAADESKFACSCDEISGANTVGASREIFTGSDFGQSSRAGTFRLHAASIVHPISVPWNCCVLLGGRSPNSRSVHQHFRSGGSGYGS